MRKPQLVSISYQEIYFDALESTSQDIPELAEED